MTYAQPFDDSLGDASGVSPYTAEQLSLFLKNIGDFVIAEYHPASYEDPLAVYAEPLTLGNGQIGILAGKAIVKGALYENTAATTMNIDAAVNNRVDRIVLRFSSANHTVRLTLIKGAEAANPSIPALTANDFALAWVYVTAGFNPATTDIVEEDVHDERIIWNTGDSSYHYSTINLLPNSEYIGYSQPAAGNVAPEGWRLTAVAPTSILSATRPTVQPRGRGIRIQSGGANRGMRTQLRLTDGWYTLRCTVNVTSGGARIHLSDGIADKLEDIKITGSNKDVLIRLRVTSGEAQLYIEGTSAGDDFIVSQIVISQGFHPGYYRHQHELIMLDTALTDAVWTATAKSTGTTLIDMSASFGSILTTGMSIRGVILRLRARDSGSSGALCGLYTAVDTATPLSILELSRMPNDDTFETIGFAPMIGGLGITFYLGVTATGAGTLDATVEIIGIIT